MENDRSEAKVCIAPRPAGRWRASAGGLGRGRLARRGAFPSSGSCYSPNRRIRRGQHVDIIIRGHVLTVETPQDRDGVRPVWFPVPQPEDRREVDFAPCNATRFAPVTAGMRHEATPLQEVCIRQSAGRHQGEIAAA